MSFTRREVFGLAGGAAALAVTQAPKPAQAQVQTSASIVIIGAGAAGAAIANRLANRLSGAKITVLDPSAQHIYQPGLSLVAAGLAPAGYVVNGATTDWLPRDITFIAEGAAAVDAVANTVTTTGGQRLQYDFLVLAPGLVLDHDAIEGFSLDMVGEKGIGALYAGPEYAARTWAAASRFIEEGGRGVFTRPATNMKCAGAPVKHTFLIDDLLTRAGNRGKAEIAYFAPQGSLFGVPVIHERVRQLFDDRNMGFTYRRTLRSIDADARIATFTDLDGFEYEEPYDYIHIVPPQRAPDFIVESDLHVADRWVGEGWAECDMHSLRHLRHHNIWAVGDIAGVPKGKTAASVKWQVPVVEDQIVAAVQGSEGSKRYDGYTSCPLITRVGRAMLVEFDYKNNLVPSFPGIVAPLEELWISWLMKEVALKPTYNAMLRGRA